MTEADLHKEILRLRAAFLVKLARRLGLVADQENVRELLQTHDDATVLSTIEATQGWSLPRALAVIRRWFGFG